MVEYGKTHRTHVAGVDYGWNADPFEFRHTCNN